jgi:hypothetical protein
VVNFERDAGRRNNMKEMLTKSFWQDVKRTFYTALEGPPAKDNSSQAPAESKSKDSPKSEISSPPSANSE